MMKNKINAIHGFQLFILLISLSIISCEQKQGDVLFTGDDYQNLMQFLYEDTAADNSSFIRIIEAGEMVDVLSSYNSNVGGSRFTLFLPDNDAVDKFIESSLLYNSLEEILADKDFSKELVKYHVLNEEVFSDEFPNGALPTRTLSEDFLTIKFSDDNGIISYYLNNETTISAFNIEKSNGIVHRIDQMLSPVVYTAYQWIKINQNNGYTIFAQLLDETGVKDTLNAYVINDFGIRVYNKYTLIVESDERYQNNGISSFSDLIDFIGAEDDDYTNPDNAVNKYVKYHILNQGLFLDEFASDDEDITSSIYDTYGDAPVSVDFGLDLKFNIGTEKFEAIIEDGDTIGWIDYLLVDLDNSNILTKTGPIHQLDRLLKPFIPGRTQKEFEFYNDAAIDEVRSNTGTVRIKREDLTAIELIGVETLQYIKENAGIVGVRNRDYLSLYGNFSMIYTTPRLLAGAYRVSVVAHGSSRAADFVTYVNGTSLGGIQKLRQESSAWLAGGRRKILGNITFSGYEEQKIEFRTLFTGRFMIDRIIFEPI